MADRYWVGGTGTWNTSSTTNWSTASGGAGGASVPTATDNVFFDANSGTGTVTIGSAVSCSNFDCTGYAGTMAGSSTLQFYGTIVTFSSGMTYTHTGTLLFSASGAVTVLITSAGKSLRAVTIGSLAGSATAIFSLQDNLTVVNTLTLTYGTLNSNNFNISATSLSSSSSNTRALNLGSSTVTLSGTSGALDFSTSTNLAFNAGTSTIVFSSTSNIVFYGGGNTFYNVSFTGNAASTNAITGANTFNNITVTTNAVRLFNFSANNTINGVLASSGSGYIKLYSDTAGTQRTLTVANAPTTAKIIFVDINFAGAASPWTAPLGVADYGNNSGIVFDTTTLYWYGGTGNWASVGHWSTSTGGGGTTSLIPGKNNSVIFDANSGASSSCTAASDFCNDLTISSSPTTISGQLNVYGSLNITAFAGSSYASLIPYFYATSTGKTIRTSGSTVGSIRFDGVGGEWTLQDDLPMGAGSFLSLWAGSLVTNNFNISGAGILFQTTKVKSITLGSSTLTFSNTSPVSVSGSSLTFNADTSTFVLTNTSNITWTPTGLTFYNVNFTGRTSLGFMTITVGADFIVNNLLTVTGRLGNQRVRLNPATDGTQVTISAGSVSLVDVDFRGIICAGTATWSGTRIGDAGLNVNLLADAPKSVYWSLAAGGSMISTAWATTPGGTPDGLNSPLPQDTAIFVDTGLNTSATVTIGLNLLYLPALDFSGRTAAMTFNWSHSSYLCGNVTFASVVTNSGSSGIVITRDVIFSGTMPASFNPGITVRAVANFTISSNFTFNSTIQVDPSAFCTANSAFTSTTSVVMNGTFALNNNSVTISTMSLGAAAVLNFGTSGRITLTGTGTVFQGNNAQTILGTSDVWVVSSVVSVRSFNCGTQAAESNMVNVTINAPASGNFTLSGYSKNLTLLTGAITALPSGIYGSLYIASAVTLPASPTFTLQGTSGTKTIYSEKTFYNTFTLNGAGSTWVLNSNLTFGDLTTSGIFTHSAGTLNMNGFNITANYYFVGGSGVRAVNFDSGEYIKIIGGNGLGSQLSLGPATNFSYTGTPKIYIDSSATTTASFVFGNPAFDVYVRTGSYPISFSDNVGTLDFTGFSGSVPVTSVSIYRNLVISSGMSLATGGVSAWNFKATSGTNTITSNGKVFDFPIVFDGVGGTWALQDNLTLGSGSSTTATLTNGTLDLNGKKLTCQRFSTAAGTKDLTFNSGTLQIDGATTTAFNNAQPANFTTTAGTGTGFISMTAATAKTFVGGGSVYNCTLRNAGAGALTISGSNTFLDINNSVQPTTFTFTSGTTTTVSNFTVSGTAGNLVTLNVTSTTNATLSKASGTVDVNYCSITRSTATGGALWSALIINGNVNGGNNVGWDFGSVGNGLLFGSNF